MPCVFIVPSATQFTVMLWRPTSRATDRQKPAAPALAAEYAAMWVSPTRAVSEITVTTRPHCASIIAGSAARTAYITP